MIVAFVLDATTVVLRLMIDDVIRKADVIGCCPFYFVYFVAYWDRCIICFITSAIIFTGIICNYWKGTSYYVWTLLHSLITEHVLHLSHGRGR